MSSKRKFIGYGFAISGFVASIGVAVPPSAQAANSQCSTGYACLWGENDYTGCFAQYSSSARLGYWQSCSQARVNANNGANAVKNEGRNCDVRFYDNVDQTGPWLYFSREVTGQNYQDPYLKNGGGTSAYRNQNWQDRIGSLAFVACR